MTLLGDGEFAVTKCVPQLDGSVAGTGDNLSVVSGEGDGEDIVGVADESSGGGTGGKLPKAESLVPGGRESVSSVRGDDLNSKLAFVKNDLFCFCHKCAKWFEMTYTVGDDVRVTVKGSLWVTVGGVVAGQVPDDQGLVAGSRQEHVWVLEGGSEGSNPAAVALKGALQDKSLRHVEDRLIVGIQLILAKFVKLRRISKYLSGRDLKRIAARAYQISPR